MRAWATAPTPGQCATLSNQSGHACAWAPPQQLRCPTQPTKALCHAALPAHPRPLAIPRIPTPPDYAAIPSHVFDRERDCGKCYKIRGTEDDAPGKWVYVKIVDGEPAVI